MMKGLKGIPTLVKKNNGSIRHKTIQYLQMLILMFVTISLMLKIYVQMFPYTENVLCAKCALLENQSENKESISSIPADDLDYNEPDTYENDVEIDTQPAYHPLPYSDNTYDFTVVTGASMNHFCPMKSFLYYMKDTLEGLNARLIVYDLGFSDSQKITLKQLRNNGYFTELREFQFSHYPSFWNISEAKGEYAWKPGMIAEVARDYPGKLVWLDSGTLAKRKYFEKLDSLLRKHKGFISPRSSSTMKVWTHPGVYDYYGDDHNLYDDLPNCNGASVTFDTIKYKHIIDDWFNCALVKDCIAPPGSSRLNHRQDQAILTYLAAKNNLRCNITKGDIGIRTHEDRRCRKYINRYELTHDL